ncbi:MAG: single-stranded-DNA-specific exonuclease RecJ [Chloroflexi bacterium CFX1]|nr:single-stranded-DNA-specific exonuclease RecJ [Chloroflexi bacterium CFX1]MCQ3953161.1 single-stranded-DNA-specific exonuclease RecJ [Chloroflexota bacterium]MDL1919521.1 single-stranded-DNA-specific exonuclease RecJ [Chloroflexi bacterium CFX5]
MMTVEAFSSGASSRITFSWSNYTRDVVSYTALPADSGLVYTRAVMKPQDKHWNIPPRIAPEADSALQAFPPLLRQALYNRGFADDASARAFLRGEPSHNTDPFQMTDMGIAIERILHAVERNETIAVYGDYDVDGVTATALLVEALKHLGANAIGYIPNRFDEGYGLNNNALDDLKAQGVKLVVSVDCGIRSPNEAAHARTLGLDLIISDHHHPDGENLPAAFAVINPKRHGDLYPDKDLAGVGIAYKIAEALTILHPSSFILDSLLDLVALGTVADLAPLVGENRVLVKKGLRQMSQTRRQGLFSLAAVAELNLKKVNAGHIGFMLGPRLNAAGRLKEALAAFELLTTSDVFKAGELAQQLDMQNRERQRITREAQTRAEEIALSGDPDTCLLFAAHEDFNPGVVGLAASRLTDKYYRPAIVASKGADETRGSCRSIPEFHITDALDQCADLLVRHGGHAAAAGFTVRNENLEELVSRLKAIAGEKLSGTELKPTLTADAEVDLSEMRPEVYEKGLKYLEPTGYGNREATFVARSVKVKSSRTVGAEGKHLKLTLEDSKGVVHDAIGFKFGERHKSMPPRVDVLFVYEPNEYNGRVTYQLNLKDLKAANGR